MKFTTRARSATGVAVALAATYAITSLTNASADSDGQEDQSSTHQVEVEVFAPEDGDRAGVSGAGWFVDMELNFRDSTLAQTGFSGLQLTGPPPHADMPPFPGAFATGHDDRLPGLVVLTSTTNHTLPGFSGPGTNLAGLFNLTGVTNRDRHDTELWDTWIVGAPIAGTDVKSTLTVAVIDDLNHDGIFNDAPDVVTDHNGDGRVDRRDLKKIGVASNVETVRFRINGDPA